MSVEQSNVIDFVSTDKEDDIVLTISDHLEWDAANKHILILQDKINAYLRFLESGEIFEHYPQAKNRKCVIKVVSLHPPSEDGKSFLAAVKNTVEGAGFGFYFEQKHFNSPA